MVTAVCSDTDSASSQGFCLKWDIIPTLMDISWFLRKFTQPFHPLYLNTITTALHQKKGVSFTPFKRLRSLVSVQKLQDK